MCRRSCFPGCTVGTIPQNGDCFFREHEPGGNSSRTTFGQILFKNRAQAIALGPLNPLRQWRLRDDRTGARSSHQAFLQRPVGWRAAIWAVAHAADASVCIVPRVSHPNPARRTAGFGIPARLSRFNDPLRGRCAAPPRSKPLEGVLTRVVRKAVQKRGPTARATCGNLMFSFGYQEKSGAAEGTRTPRPHHYE